MDYKELCFQVQNIAHSTGNFIRSEQKKLSEKNIEIKSVASLVTYVDKTAEKQIVDALRKLVPEAGFVAEEGTAESNNEKYTWFVDPLDGTTNYLHGLAPHSVSIALANGDELVLGVVYEVGADEMYYAWKGGPAYCNDEIITAASRSKSEDTLIATGFPYYAFEKVNEYIEAMKHLMQSTRGIRRFGSAAVDLCYVASGRFDAFYEHALHAWDVAAGVFILQQAGGKTTDFNGGKNWLFGGEIVSASNAYFPEFYGIVNKYLGKK
ncbi:MAG TPA: inositol monophosphatase family protein [Draconibacterium sp.]|nr:inositol monophosphatase family protein [Draconibacterium sp.]